MTDRQIRLLSIIIPSFNQGRYLREAIDSILAQDYRPVEILVIDGGSSDETVDVLRSCGELPELQWWSEPDRGVVEAVNKGMSRVRGEIVAIQSSDDGYLPGAFTAVMEFFEAHPNVSLVYGDVEYIDEGSQVTGKTSLGRFDLADYVGKLTYIPQPSAFFRADAMRVAGTWREDISYAADAEFFLRLVERHGASKIDRVLARYRYHDTQRDKESTRVPRDWATAIEPWTRHREPGIRRSARLGILRVHHHYTPESRWARRTLLSWRILLASPREVARLDWRELIPGRYPFWSMLSRVKRMLGFAPRRK